MFGTKCVPFLPLPLPLRHFKSVLSFIKSDLHFVILITNVTYPQILVRLFRIKFYKNPSVGSRIAARTQTWSIHYHSEFNLGNLVQSPDWHINVFQVTSLLQATSGAQCEVKYITPSELTTEPILHHTKTLPMAMKILSMPLTTELAQWICSI